MTERPASNGNDRISRRREHELLLLCARARVEDERAGRIRALVREGVDFDYLFRLAQRHLILPLLYHQLSKAASDITPAAHLQKLKILFRDNAARNIYLAGELCKLIRAFEEKGIEAAPFKGPTLALLAYGDLSLRRFIDLDILVQRRDIQRAKEVLIASGYEPKPRLTPAQESVLLREQHALQFVREGGHLIVELHWAVVPRKFADVMQAEDFWGRTVKLKFSGAEVLSLSPEDLLLSLCAHGTKHLWERLVWICDVAELVEATPGLNWGEVSDRARAAGLERMLFLGLSLAGEVLDTSLPDEVRREALCDGDVSGMVSFVRERLFDGPEYKPAGFMQNIDFNLRARRRLRDKFRYFGFIVTPTDGDLAALRLPAALIFLYYFLRPLRLLLKGDERH